MMLDAFGDINWLATAVAALIYFALGGFWFSHFVLGHAWDRSIGFTRPANWKPGSTYYVGPLLSCLAGTLAVSALVNATSAQSATDAVALGLVVGIGYGAGISFVNAITPHTPRPLLFGTVTGAYHALGLTIVALILTYWN